jgi:hypothetical protein
MNADIEPPFDRAWPSMSVVFEYRQDEDFDFIG